MCGRVRDVVLPLLLTATLGCGWRPPLPTLSLHAVLTLREGSVATTKQTGTSDVGLLAQLAFRPRETPRAGDAAQSAQLPIALPRPPDCQHALACEWAQLAEESALSALGVGP
jgi:hypothetical protein